MRLQNDYIGYSIFDIRGEEVEALSRNAAKKTSVVVLCRKIKPAKAESRNFVIVGAAKPFPQRHPS